MRNYLSAAIAKTGVRNRVEAMRVADERGWLVVRTMPRQGQTVVRQDLGRDEFEVVEVADVEHLQVDPGRAELGELADPVDDLGRRAGDAALAQLVDVSPDRVGAAPHLGVVAADDGRSGPPSRRARARSAPRPSRTRSKIAGTSCRSKPTLYSSANRAASAAPRFLPAPPRMIGGRGRLHRLRQRGRVLERGSARRRSRTSARRASSQQPVDDLHLLGEPVEALADGRERDAVRACARARTSRLPRPSSTRPPLISSTWATAIASGPGSRKVAGVDQRAEPDAARLAGERGEGEPRVGRAGQAVAGRPSTGSGRSGRTRRSRAPRRPWRRGAGRRSWRPAGVR